MQVTRKRLAPGEMPTEPGLYEFFPYTQTVFFDGVNFLPIAVPPSALPGDFSTTSAAASLSQVTSAAPDLAAEPSPLPQPLRQPTSALAFAQLPHPLLLQQYAQQRAQLLLYNQPSQLQLQQLQQLHHHQQQQQQQQSVSFANVRPPPLPKPRQVVPSPLAPGTSSFTVSIGGSAPPFFSAFALGAGENFANSVPNSPAPRSITSSSAVSVAYIPTSNHDGDQSEDEDEAVEEVEVNLFEYPKKTPVVLRKPDGATVASPSKPSPGVSTPSSKVIPGIDRKPDGTSRGGGTERTMPTKLSALAPEFVSNSGYSPKTSVCAPVPVPTESAFTPDPPAFGQGEYQSVPESTRLREDVKAKKLPAEGADIQNSPLKSKPSLPSSAQAATSRIGDAQNLTTYRTSSSVLQKPTTAAPGKSKKQQSPVPSVRRQTAPIPAVDGWGKTMSNGWTCRATSALSTDDGGWGAPPVAPSWEIDPWKPSNTASRNSEIADVWDSTPARKAFAIAPGKEATANSAAGVDAYMEVAAENDDTSAVADKGDHPSRRKLTRPTERGKGRNEEGMHGMDSAVPAAPELSGRQLKSMPLSHEFVGEPRVAASTVHAEVPPPFKSNVPEEGRTADVAMPAPVTAASTEHADVPPPPILDTSGEGKTATAGVAMLAPAPGASTEQTEVPAAPKLEAPGEETTAGGTMTEPVAAASTEHADAPALPKLDRPGEGTTAGIAMPASAAGTPAQQTEVPSRTKLDTPGEGTTAGGARLAAVAAASTEHADVYPPNILGTPGEGTMAGVAMPAPASGASTEQTEIPSLPKLDTPGEGTTAGGTMAAPVAAAATEYTDASPLPKSDKPGEGTTAGAVPVLAAAAKDTGPEHSTFHANLDDKIDDRRWSMATLRDEIPETEKFAGEKHPEPPASALPSNTSSPARQNEKRGEARGEKPLFRVKLKLPDGKMVFLAYHENDQPEEVAQRFCRAWYIPATFVPSITKLLQAEVAKAEARRACEL